MFKLIKNEICNLNKKSSIIFYFIITISFLLILSSAFIFTNENFQTIFYIYLGINLFKLSFAILFEGLTVTILMNLIEKKKASS